MRVTSSLCAATVIDRVSTLARTRFRTYPPGLFVLCFVELWERFSFYGMRALLVVYMTHVVLVQPVDAVEGLGVLSGFLGLDPVTDKGALVSELYGLYSGLVYFTPLLGGYLADRFFSRDAVVIAGGALIVLGHLMLTTSTWFLLALVLIVLGTGGLKGNIAARVVDLYPEDDPRLSRGFSLFYVGINIGAALAPFVCAGLALRYTWGLAFGATSVGMVLALATYCAGRRCLPRQTVPRMAVAAGGGRSVNIWLLAAACALVWVSYEQQANGLMRWLSGRPGGIGQAWLQAIPPLVVLLGTPVLLRVWRVQARQGREVSAARKIVWGATVILLAQAILWLFAFTGPAPPPVIGIVFYLALWEAGDLLFSPAAMDVFATAAAPGRAGMGMAVWYLTIFVGNLASGWIGVLWGRLPVSSYWLVIVMTTVAGVAGLSLATMKRDREACYDIKTEWK
nr:peptide MFS transporter [Ameyamaea chiangmaiensis]